MRGADGFDKMSRANGRVPAIREVRGGIVEQTIRATEKKMKKKRS